MRFVLSENQNEFKQLARTFFTEQLPVEGAVVRVDSGLDDVLWARAVQEIGVNLLLVPEDYGGMGGSFLDLAMVIEEAGAALADLPLASSAAVSVSLLAQVARRRAGGVAGDLLSRLAGSTLAVAVVDPSRDAGIDVRADESGHVLFSGSCVSILDAPRLGALLVFGGDGADRALYLVELDGVTATTSETAVLDPSRRFGDVTLRDAVATMVAHDKDGSLQAWAVAANRTALALDAVGGARRCLHLAVEYANQREQFGHPIGSFQAIKHKCADMLLKVASATSAAEAAAWSLSHPELDVAEVSMQANLAKTYACDAYTWVAGELIQVLGGIGFTWEHPAHLFFKRAKADSLLCGTPEGVRAEQVAALGLMSTR